MHNTTYFHPHKPKSMILNKYQPYVPLNILALQPPPLTLLKYIHTEIYTTQPPPYTRKTTTTLHSKVTLSNDIESSRENLFHHINPQSHPLQTLVLNKTQPNIYPRTKPNLQKRWQVLLYLPS